MKKQLLYLISSTVIFWSFSGCATTARYSPEEIKDYPPEVQEHIKNGEVALGMTTLQVRYAWGAPATVNLITWPDDGALISNAEATIPANVNKFRFFIPCAPLRKYLRPTFKVQPEPTAIRLSWRIPLPGKDHSLVAFLG